MNMCDEAAAAAGCIHSSTLHSSHRNKSPFHFLFGGNTLGTGHLLTCTPARSNPASVHVVGQVGGKAAGDNPRMQGLRERTQAGMEDLQHTKIQKIPSFLIETMQMLT